MWGKKLQVGFDFAFRNIVFVGGYDCVHENFVGCVYVVGGLHIDKSVFFFFREIFPVCFPVIGVAS